MFEILSIPEHEKIGDALMQFIKNHRAKPALMLFDLDSPRAVRLLAKLDAANGVPEDGQHLVSERLIDQQSLAELFAPQGNSPHAAGVYQELARPLPEGRFWHCFVGEKGFGFEQVDLTEDGRLDALGRTWKLPHEPSQKTIICSVNPTADGQGNGRRAFPSWSTRTSSNTSGSRRSSSSCFRTRLQPKCYKSWTTVSRPLVPARRRS